MDPWIHGSAAGAAAGAAASAASAAAVCIRDVPIVGALRAPQSLNDGTMKLAHSCCGLA